MKRKYADPKMQQFYERLVQLGTPENVLAAHIAGSILGGFTAGYHGLKKPVYIGNKNAASTAYYAGKDAAKKQSKSS